MVDFENVAALLFLSVSIRLNKVTSQFLLSQGKYGSPSLISVLALPFVSAQQNTVETVVAMPHIGFDISGLTHIFLLLLWRKLENSGRYALNRSVGFHSPLPDLRMFSTLQDEPGHFLVKALFTSH